MQYRELGDTGIDVSILSLGTNRLPEDDQEAVHLMRTAAGSGVNYFDTAPVYDDGRAENLLAEIIARYPDVRIATKLPLWEVDKEWEAAQQLIDSLDRLTVHPVDFYLLHSLNWEYWKENEYWLPEWLERQQANGLIDYAGFSWSGSREGFRKVIDEFDWSIAMIQLNWLDGANFELAAHAYMNEVGVATLRPLREGSLAKENNLVDWSSEFSGGPVERSLNLLWDSDVVSTVTVGTGKKEHLLWNLDMAERFERFSIHERSLFSRAYEKYYESEAPVTCYGCGDCLPCPEGVWIPRNFKALNDQKVLDFDGSRTWEHLQGHTFDQCTDCGICGDRCPVDMDIPARLKAVKDEFEKS